MTISSIYVQVFSRLDSANTGSVSRSKFEDVMERFMIGITDPEYKILYASLSLLENDRVKYQGFFLLAIFKILHATNNQFNALGD